MLSEELRRQREARGASLESMARETRISLHFLRAIESGNLDALPEGFYRKAFLRAYARYVGVPEERVLASYDYYRAPGAGSRERAGAVGRASGRLSSSRLGARSRTAVGLSVASLLMLAAVVTGAGTFWPGRGPARRLSDGQGQSGEGRETRREPPRSGLELPFVPEETEPRGGAAISADLAEGLQVAVEVTDSCWLEVRADGVLLSAGTLAGGQREEFRAEREVRLSLGNAGGVSLRINGRPGKPLGKPGQVLKNLRITRDNFRDFLAS